MNEIEKIHQELTNRNKIRTISPKKFRFINILIENGIDMVYS